MKAGSYVEVKTKRGDVLVGLVMDSSDKKVLSLKLDSGYNMGLDKKNISKIKSLKKTVKKVSKKEEKIKLNKKLKTVSILHTGGTVASKVDYSTGAVYPSFSPSDLVRMFPEIKNIANIKSKLIRNMWSEDMRFSHYNLLAKEIQKEIKNGADGVVITHGTDTIAYTAAALSFALENLDKPIIIVGAQRSSDRPSSDAAMNLVCAINFIVKSNFSDVGVCMHGKSGDEFCLILPGLKAKKLHSSRRDAFRVVNGNYIAKVSKDGKIEFLSKYRVKKNKDKLKLKLFNEKLKIGVLKAHPNLFRDEVRNFSKFHGLIIEGTGLGHISAEKIDNLTLENNGVLLELKKLCKKIPVVMVSQCIFGRVNMNVYKKGRTLQEIGVLGNYLDMTFESSFIKLAWLLSNYKKKDVKDLVSKNFRGEISKRVIYSEEFV